MRRPLQPVPGHANRTLAYYRDEIARYIGRHYRTLSSHLQTAVDTPNLDPYLKSALQEVLGGWQATHCHPNSISVDFYPLTAPGCLTH